MKCENYFEAKTISGFAGIFESFEKMGWIVMGNKF